MRVAAIDLNVDDLVKLVFTETGKTIYGRVWFDDGDVLMIRSENHNSFYLVKSDGTLEGSSDVGLFEAPEIYRIDLEDDQIDSDDELHGIFLDAGFFAEDFVYQNLDPVESLSDDLKNEEVLNSDLTELEIELRYRVTKLNKLLERVENLNNKRFNKN